MNTSYHSSNIFRFLSLITAAMLLLSEGAPVTAQGQVPSNTPTVTPSLTSTAATSVAPSPTSSALPATMATVTTAKPPATVTATVTSASTISVATSTSAPASATAVVTASGTSVPATAIATITSSPTLASPTIAATITVANTSTAKPSASATASLPATATNTKIPTQIPTPSQTPPPPTNAPRQDGKTEWSSTTSLPAPNKVRAQILSQPPEISSQQRALSEDSLSRTHLKGPSVSVGPNASTRNGSPTIPETIIGGTNGAKAADTFSIFQNNSLASGPSKSQINEPSVANNGQSIFASYNWYAALSTNNGSSWSYISPYTAFPSANGGFCCDQDVLYDRSHDLMFWLLQYVSDTNGNILRLAVSKGQSNLAAGTWYYYDFAPETYCGVNNSDWFDFPHLALTNNYLYLSSNVFTSGGSFSCTTMIRLSLDQLSAGGALSGINAFNSSGFNFTAAHGGTDTLYWARHLNTTELRIYTWAESGGVGSVTWTDVTHASYLNSSYNCTITSSGINPCGSDDDRVISGWLRRDNNQLGFMWDAAQGTDGLGTFPYPHVRRLIVNATTKAVVSDSTTWASTAAFLLPSSGVNARGHVGGTMTWAGGTFQPNCGPWLYDDFSTSFASTILSATSGNTSPSSNRWGDYLRTRQSSKNPFQWIGSCYAIEGGTVTPRIVQFGRERDKFGRAKTDFDGDGKTDPAKFYSTTGTMWWIKSSTNTMDGKWLGPDTFTAIGSGDYDGDGKTDPAKFYSTTGTVWWIKSSTNTMDGKWLGGDTFTFVGGGDYDGDGKTDPAKFYSTTGTVWWIKSSTNTIDGKWLGGDTFTFVGGGDYDGDGKTDAAKFYSTTGTLWWIKSSTNTIDGTWLGSDVFTFVGSGDYDGDGKTDPAKFYPSTGTLWWLKSSTGTWEGAWLGSGTYTLVTGKDYDGDGKTDPAKFDSSTGTVWWLKSSTGTWEGKWLGSDSFVLVQN